jgi:hypothetical protein
MGRLLACPPKTIYIDRYGTLYCIHRFILSAELTGSAAALRALKT